MQEDEWAIEKLVLVRLVRLNGVIIGLTFGLLLGLGIFVATNVLLLKGGSVVGPHLSLLAQYFIGYQVTFLGSLVGLFYGLALGFVAGYAFAFLYNAVSSVREKRRSKNG